LVRIDIKNSRNFLVIPSIYQTVVKDLLSLLAAQKKVTAFFQTEPAFIALLFFFIHVFDKE
jgi:hypothetical protein